MDGLATGIGVATLYYWLEPIHRNIIVQMFRFPARVDSGSFVLADVSGRLSLWCPQLLSA